MWRLTVPTTKQTMAHPSPTISILTVKSVITYPLDELE